MNFKIILTLYLLFLYQSHCDGQYKVNITVHDFSPIPRESIYISGSFNNWDTLPNPQRKFTKVKSTIHSITLNLNAGRHEFKLNGGNWSSVEKTGVGSEFENRSFTIQSDTSLSINVYQWRDLMIPGNRMALQQAKEDSTRLKAMTVLAIAFSGDPIFYNTDSSLYYAQSAMQVINRMNATGKGKSWNDYNWWINTLRYNYATLLRSRGNYLKALEVRLDILRFQESLNDTMEMISALHQIANEYLQVKDYDNTLGSSYRALKLLHEVRILNSDFHTFLTLQTNLQLATVYFYKQDYGKSLTYAKSASETAQPTYYYHVLSSIDQLIGDIFFKMHLPDSAKLYYWEAISYSTSSHNLQALSLTLKGLANISREKNQIDSALYFARLSLNIVQNNKSHFQASGEFADSYIAEISPLIADLYRRQNQLDSAYHYLMLSVTLKDSLFNNQKIRDIQNMAFNEATRIQKEAQLKEEEQQRATTRLKTYAFLIGILILSLLAILQYRNSRQKSTINNQLRNQKKDLENTLHTLQLTQKQLIQSEKMASLGELTAGIAHEIQNPLNFVNNFSEVNTELIDEMNHEIDKGNLPEVKSIAKDIQENQNKITEHGKRADVIVKGMLQHSRSSSGVKEPTDINALADEYLRLAYHGLRAKDKSFNATMKMDYDPSIGLVNVIPQDIGRVILNLITNAFYAVSEKQKALQTPYPLEGGPDYEPIVTVITKHQVPLSGGRGSQELGGQGVMISVSDNGPGIPAHIVDKIFQPFFTTKPTGQGTGLGLSLSYDIVKAHGGELKVETKEGEGSVFTILLPVN